MEKKSKMNQFFTLADIDYNMSYISTVAVINSISPTISRKKLIDVVLEVSDSTMHNPGFVFRLMLDKEILDDFLLVGRKGSIIVLKEVKITKDVGEVYGEVRDKEEMKLYNDNLIGLKWYSNEKLHPPPDTIRSLIQDLLKWKKLNFTEMVSTEDLGDTRRSRLSYPKSVKAITPSTVSDGNATVHATKHKSEKQNLKSNNSICSTITRKRRSSSRTDHSPDLHNSKSVSSKDDSVQIVLSPARKSSALISEKSIKKNIPEATSGINQKHFYVNLSPKQQNIKENLGSTNIKDNDLSTDSILAKDKSFEDSTINKDSTYKRSSLRSFSSPEDNENTSFSRDSSKGILAKAVKKIEIKNTPTFKNRVIEKNQTLKQKITTKHNKKSKSENYLTNKETEISSTISSKHDIVNKDSKLRFLRSGQSISMDNTNKVVKDKSDTPKSSKYNKLTDSNESQENAKKESRKLQYSSDGNELESEASKLSSSSNNSPTKQHNKHIMTESFKGQKVSIINMKIPALNSSDSSLNSDISVNNSPSTRGKQSAVQQVVSKVTKLADKNAENNHTNEKQISKMNDSSKSNKILSPSIIQEDKRKPTRSSQPKTNVLSSDSHGRFGDIYFYLQSITRRPNLKQVFSQSDVSFCDLEEIDVPDKFHLECKVISQFCLFEDNIQVIRVQDGSICKKVLTIPECSSWQGVTETILKNPVVNQNSPFVDIIIFDYNRMDRDVKTGCFYRFKNVMSVKFSLKDDPRTIADKSAEKSQTCNLIGGTDKDVASQLSVFVFNVLVLEVSRVGVGFNIETSPEGTHQLLSCLTENYGEYFFCVRGQDCYVVQLSGSKQNSIKERLEDETYKNAWNQSMNHSRDLEKSSVPDFNIVDLVKDKITSSPPGSKENHELHKVHSPKSRKRKVTDHETEKDEVFESPIKNYKLDQNSTNKNIEPRKDVKKTTNQYNINITNSSDETTLYETPCLLRELREIMHEESILGLPQTLSEDIHLKNTGSEITYSQFCKDAVGKNLNFRTSTQSDNDSQNIVPINREEVIQSQEGNKMESLVYCPSSSSLSSPLEVSPLKRKILSEDPKCHEKFSESLLRDNKAEYISEVKPTDDQVKTGVETHNEEKVKNNDSSDISKVYSIRTLSSNSSELECEIVRNDKCTKSKKVCIENLQSAARNKMFLSLHSKNLASFPKNESDVEQIEVDTDNSSNNSLSSDGKNCTVIKQIKHKTSFNSVDNKKIPGRCYFKSSLRPSLSEWDEIEVADKNSSSIYFSESRYQSLPFVSLSLLTKMICQKYLKVSVFIVSITPPVTGSWEENCVKARCPNCGKLFDVYNAANSRYNESTSTTSAIVIGSHIVCPDSQCCNQLLESPEFRISVEMKLRDGTPLSALIAGQHAEKVLGCTAQEAIKDKKQFEKVSEILKNIEKKISNKTLTQVHLTRENICDPKSGPLYLQQIYM